MDNRSALIAIFKDQWKQTKTDQGQESEKNSQSGWCPGLHLPTLCAVRRGLSYPPLKMPNAEVTLPRVTRARQVCGLGPRGASINPVTEATSAGLWYQ